MTSAQWFNVLMLAGFASAVIFALWIEWPHRCMVCHARVIKRATTTCSATCNSELWRTSNWS